MLKTIFADKPEVSNATVRSKKYSKIGKISLVLLVVLIVLAVGGVYGSIHFYKKYKIALTSPDAEAQKMTQSLISALGNLMELPKDEAPTVATISDRDKLAGQAFFKAAENGDILFAYTTAMKAILYRPSTNKIINVAPISINQTDNAVSGAKQVAPTVATMKVAYYNGSSVVGLAGVVEKTIKSKYPTAESVVLTNAAKRDYAKTVVVDISKKFSKEASDIASLLKGEVGALPAGESLPNADILIISAK